MVESCKSLGPGSSWTVAPPNFFFLFLLDLRKHLANGFDMVVGSEEIMLEKLILKLNHCLMLKITFLLFCIYKGYCV